MIQFLLVEFVCKVLFRFGNSDNLLTVPIITSILITQFIHTNISRNESLSKYISPNQLENSTE